MNWWQVAASAWHFLASLVFLVLAIKSRTVSKHLWKRDDDVKQLRMRKVNPGYWYFKCEIYNYFLDEGRDKLASIMTTVSKILEADLTRNPLSLTRCQQSKMLEQTLAELMAGLVDRFVPNVGSEQEKIAIEEVTKNVYREVNNKSESKTVALMFYQATSFYFKKELVKFMYDLKGYRRWRLTVSYLQRAIDLRRSPAGSASETPTCSRMSSCIPRPLLCSCTNCDPQVCPSDFRPYLFTRLVLRFQHICIPIGLVIWDNWSDGTVLYNYANIWSLTNSSLLTNSTIYGERLPDGSKIPEISFPVISLALIIVFSTMTLLTSIFGTSPTEYEYTKYTSCSSKALMQGLKTAEKMAELQQKFYDKDYYGFASRYQLTIAEASSESLAQHMVQWAAYFSLILILAGTDAFEQYDQYLTFRTLVFSGLASVTALTLSQVKTNSIFHEFTLTNSQKLFYLVASLTNTLGHSTLLVFICTSIFDLVFLLAAKTSFLWALLCLLFLFLSFPAICFVTSHWGKAVMEMDFRMEQREGALFGEKGELLGTNAIRHTNYNNPVVRRVLYHTENLFCHLRLPTSVSNLANQPICYQTACDARTILLTSRHYFTLHLYFLLSSLLLTAQQLWTYVDPTIVTPMYQLFSARHNLVIASYVLPFSFMTAFLFLHIYLKGTFLCNSQYVGFPETCWEDLGPVSFHLSTTIGLKLPQDITAKSIRCFRVKHSEMEMKRDCRLLQLRDRAATMSLFRRSSI